MNNSAELNIAREEIRKTISRLEKEALKLSRLYQRGKILGYKAVIQLHDYLIKYGNQRTKLKEELGEEECKKYDEQVFDAYIKFRNNLHLK